MKNKKAIIIVILTALLGWAGLNVSEGDITQIVETFTVRESPVSTSKTEFNKVSVISPQRRTHILYGDATGGGHKFGVGAPCKSEFPKHWDDDTIIQKVELIAANDNLNWEQQRNGYHVAEQKVGTVNVRVVKGRKNEQVITAYPTNTGRNPCPVNDN